MTTIAKDSVGDRLDLKGGELTAVIDTQEVLLGGDVILEIDGTEIDSNRETYKGVFARIANAHPTAQIRCKVIRSGHVIVLSTK